MRFSKNPTVQDLKREADFFVALSRREARRGNNALRGIYLKNAILKLQLAVTGASVRVKAA